MPALLRACREAVINTVHKGLECQQEKLCWSGQGRLDEGMGMGRKTESRELGEVGCVAKLWRSGVRRTRVVALEMELGASHV